MEVELSFQATGAVPGTAGPVTMRGSSLTIGRDDNNDLTLPDPDQMISRRHCVIERKGDIVVAIDLSSNGTFLNYSKSPLGKREAPLNNGDILTIGRYELVVTIGRAESRDPLADIPPPAQGEAVMDGPGQGVDDLLAPVDGRGAEGDFLDELLESPAESRTAKSLFPETDDDILPPLGDEDDPILPAAPDDPFAPAGASHGQPGHEHSDSFAPPKPAQPLIPDDFDEELGLAPRSQPAAQTPIPEADPPPPATEATEAAPPAAARAEPEPRGPAPSAPAASRDAAALFLAELGLEPGDIDAEELAAVMTRLGRVTRILIAGVRELLMTRAAIKSEFPIERTMISAAGNNPLKFSVSEEQAIRAVALEKDKGYIDGESAAEEALRDIRAHEIGMVTGMQAALRSVLDKLDPAILEERLSKDRGLAGIIQGRKARYWEAYKAKYDELKEQAEEDFETFFGREFARAYLEQMKNLQPNRPLQRDKRPSIRQKST